MKCLHCLLCVHILIEGQSATIIWLYVGGRGGGGCQSSRWISTNSTFTFSLQTNHVLRVYNVLSIHSWSEVKPAKKCGNRTHSRTGVNTPPLSRLIRLLEHLRCQEIGGRIQNSFSDQLQQLFGHHFFEIPSESHLLAKIEVMALSPKEVKLQGIRSEKSTNGTQ